MRGSSSSNPPCIKAQHKAAKRRAIRRRRIDLTCGCTIYIHLNCHSNEFTHRGTSSAVPQAENGVYTWEISNPLYFRIHDVEDVLHSRDEDIPRPDTVQPQREESIGSPHGLSQLPSLDSLGDSFWADLFK
ncbi:Trap [Cleome golden mosaic virus]|uniref:Transcriptional activator protein n=1 Tax=Cleome golden mosaic virus TaxID=858517 RepID=F5A3L0_9GEMI|nr:Trap [Cleome golden mosaic virus]AEB00553.1 Trap [Cleome golden mosaic virus]